MELNNLFSKKNFTFKEGVYIFDKNDNYTSNFGKQWKDFQNVQIDSLNKNNISLKFLNRILFNQMSILNDKTILEIGCGAGRFTEYLVKSSKLCVSVDLSAAIFYNVSKKNKNLILVKSDLMNLDFKTKFDIVICRGVIQHTPNPKETIKKIHSFVDPKGFVFFDVYKMPKLGYLHPKYLIWRPFFKFFFTYEGVKEFLIKNISWLLKLKNFVRRIFLNSYFISDIFIPIWSYDGKLELSKKMQEKWSVLDTLDGLFAKYDKPISNKNILKLLKNNKFKVINNDKKNNIFQTKT